jgi:hypothetical protein|tara:strand:+ start:543 stop:704 length:162 start_codon:yes stop_codon:yes gene_type:complete
LNDWGTVDAARAKERAKIFDIINQISVSDDIGELVYLSDLYQYIDEADSEAAE